MSWGNLSFLRIVCAIKACKGSQRKSFVMGPFYAVAKGRKTGVFQTWSECQAQILKVTGPIFKKFPTEQGALEFLQKHGVASEKKCTNTPSHVATASLKRSYSDSKPSSSSSVKTSSKKFLSTSSQNSGSTDIKRELHSLRETVEVINSNIKEFFEEKNREISSVKRKIEEILKDHQDSESSSKSGVDESSKVEPEEEDLKVKRRKVEKLSDDEKSADLKTKGFLVNDDGFVNVFTDGSCEGNGYKGARGGIGVWWNHNNKHNIGEPLNANQRSTNNVAEIQAVIEAVKVAKTLDMKKLLVNTDSQFLINCITQWLPGWKRNGWKTSQNKPVKNEEELKVLDDLLNSTDVPEVQWNHVRGHQGVEGNEEADQLARIGASKYGQSNN